MCIFLTPLRHEFEQVAGGVSRLAPARAFCGPFGGHKGWRHACQQTVVGLERRLWLALEDNNTPLLASIRNYSGEPTRFGVFSVLPPDLAHHQTRMRIGASAALASAVI